MQARKQYEFTLIVTGIGDTPEEAWFDATENLSLDTGEWNDVAITGLECVGCEMIVDTDDDEEISPDNFRCEDCLTAAHTPR